MKCDISATKKMGWFGSNCGHLTYQNLEYEGCMLDTWSNVMSRNSFHHQRNDWWDETMLHCPPYHGFQRGLFIMKTARNKKRETMKLIYELNFHVTGRRLYYFPLNVVFEVNLTGLPWVKHNSKLSFWPKFTFIKKVFWGGLNPKHPQR